MLSIGYVSKLAGSFRDFTRLYYAILLMLISTSATAVQSLEEIHKLSVSFLQQNIIEQGSSIEDIRIKVSHPDKRLRLSQCQHTLINFIPEYSSNTGNTTVGVRCESPKWQIYLPARVEQLVEVWIAKRNFRKGDFISINDISKVKRAKSMRSQSVEFEENSTQIMKASKSIRMGNVISVGDLCAICKGEQVELRVKSASLTVRMFGIALKNGLQGEMVQARNNTSKKTVTGVVVAPGVLEMTL